MTTYFTVDRSSRLTQGLTIDLTKYQDVDPPFLQDHVNEIFPEGVSNHGERYFLRGSNAATVASPNIELQWEHIRRSVQPDAPSRFQSLFATASLPEAQQFAGGYGAGPIWEVESQSGFRADMTWLTLAGSILVVSQAAYAYWRQEPRNQHWTQSGPPSWEYLLPLPVTIGQRLA